MVAFLLPGKKYSGLTKSLKIVTALSMTTVAVTGFSSGNTMFVNILILLQPSIKPDSSSSSGMVFMKPRYNIMVKGVFMATSSMIIENMDL